MRFRVSFQFVGTASGFPLSEDIYADSEPAARRIAQSLAANYGYRLLKIERAEPAYVPLGRLELPEALKVSIGICCYNEAANIGNLLENLLTRQALPADGEILVVCSGSTDRTPLIVESFARRDERVRLVTEPVRNGKAHALNLILDTYRGDCLVHLDADHSPSAGAITSLVEPLKQPDVGAAAGVQVVVNMDNFASKLAQVVYGVHHITQRYYANRGYLVHLGGVLFAVKRGICSRVPEDIVNDDAYIAVQCRLRGLRVVYEDRAQGRLRAPQTVREFVTQRRRIVYGHMKVRKDTGMSPTVLEMGGPLEQLKIVHNWSVKNLRLLPYLLAVVMLEAGVNLAARFDMATKSQAHVVWRMAESTKAPVPPAEAPAQSPVAPTH